MLRGFVTARHSGIVIFLNLPRRDPLRGPYKEDKISSDTIAKIALVPESYLRFALRDSWQETLDIID